MTGMFHGLIGRSRTQRHLFDLLRRAAPCLRSALVTGETGTGKELVVRALHALGPRPDRPLIVVNCALLDPGHPGFPRAEQELFELANDGTLFLDEIAELAPSVQAQLLRVLEYGEVPRQDGPNARRIDLIAIASTSRDLAAEAAAGRFRRDLYYRLSVVHLPLAPLRERREDIPLLTSAFISEFNRSIRHVTGVAAAAERLLEDDAWPGNVRELRNVLQRACIRSEGDVLSERTVAAAMSTCQVQAVAYRHALASPHAAAI